MRNIYHFQDTPSDAIINAYKCQGIRITHQISLWKHKRKVTERTKNMKWIIFNNTVIPHNFVPFSTTL